MQFYSEDKLLRIRVYKFRRLAEKLTNRFIDDFLWCTSENHARAFATLINKHCVSYEDTIKILKNIQQKNEIECIALGATHTESKHMNPIQRYCFVQFNLISSESLPFVRYKKS